MTTKINELLKDKNDADNLIKVLDEKIYNYKNDIRMIENKLVNVNEQFIKLKNKFDKEKKENIEKENLIQNLQNKINSLTKENNTLLIKYKKLKKFLYV